MKLYSVVLIQEVYPAKLTVNAIRQVARSKEEAIGTAIGLIDRLRGSIAYQTADEIPLSFLKEAIAAIEASK